MMSEYEMGITVEVKPDQLRDIRGSVDAAAKQVKGGAQAVGGGLLGIGLGLGLLGVLGYLKARK